MTLIEVVGGLALMATLLVAILLAKGRYTHQTAIAARRIRAVAAADALMTQWHQDIAKLPRSSTGIFPGDDGFSWRTRVVPNAAIREFEAEVIRLEILDNRIEARANPVLTSVEFIVEPRPEKRIGAKVDTSRSIHPTHQGS
jgi:hypothetical protein